MSEQAQPWWKHAVTYQVYVRSFADSDGDGVGDLPGITARLDHLADLGVDALWITPFYTSPQHDHGYDVADYRDVDPLFGDLAAFDALAARAHELGLKVVVDLVPNHTSSEHAWFRAALAAGPGSPERARYLFRDEPNNWRSVFGGRAWTQARAQGATGPGADQWYLHLFDSSQPDLDWRNPEVGEEFADVLRFWLDRGVDGFRVDVAHGLFKAEGLPDHDYGDRPANAAQAQAEAAAGESMVERHADDEPMWDQPEVHEVYRRWHGILAEASAGGQERMMVAEAWAPTAESLARYIRPDEFQQAFNFSWLLAPWSARAFADVITTTLDATGRVGASPTWVLSNHDVVRHPSRYGGGEQGLARGRAATLAMLTLPGSAYLYQGEELGLEQVDVAPEDRQDPAWLRTRDTDAPDTGRDGCRVPLPWSGDAAPYGFGPGTGQPWVPQPDGWSDRTVAAQCADPGSTLAFYRDALRVRRDAVVGQGDEVVLLDAGHDDLLAFRRGGVVCLVNCGTDPVDLPADVEGAELLLSSRLPAPGEQAGDDRAVLADGTVPPDVAVWLAV